MTKSQRQAVWIRMLGIGLRALGWYSLPLSLYASVFLCIFSWCLFVGVHSCMSRTRIQMYGCDESTLLLRFDSLTLFVM